MTVFVTGATGYIGSAVVQALQAEGHDVNGLARSPEAAAKLEAAGVEVVWGSLTELSVLSRGARAADAVIHLGATGNEDQGEVDTAAVGAMLNAVEGTGKPFVYTSGIWVLGPTGERAADVLPGRVREGCPQQRRDGADGIERRRIAGDRRHPGEAHGGDEPRR